PRGARCARRWRRGRSCRGDFDRFFATSPADPQSEGDVALDAERRSLLRVAARARDQIDRALSPEGIAVDAVLVGAAQIPEELPDDGIGAEAEHVLEQH